MKKSCKGLVNTESLKSWEPVKFTVRTKLCARVLWEHGQLFILWEQVLSPLSSAVWSSFAGCFHAVAIPRWPGLGSVAPLSEVLCIFGMALL